MQTLRENIMEILLQSKRLGQEQLEKALHLQKERQVPLRNVLIEQGIISEGELLSLLSEKLYIPSLHLSRYKFDPQIIGLVPERVARLYNVIPLSRIGTTLTVAVSDPLNIFALDDLKVLTGLNIDTVLSPEDEIIKVIDTQYHLDYKEMRELTEAKEDLQIVKTEEVEFSAALRESEKAPIVKLVDIMLSHALKKRASDIHLEPEEECLRIRYRIDGALHDISKIPKLNQNAVIARIKIISNLDITESRLPQDGRFKLRFDGREVDFRVSALPTAFGQKFVLRLLDKFNLSVGLDKLGFSKTPLEIFKEAVAKPFGMILVTGPTGSGKSTTLYSILNQLNTPERNIITIEDPVEYQLEGITQIQVKPQIGLDFASGLRSLLRQSPDVIMIGEIRDSETADIAIKAALTGQLVFSTLHTNDCLSSITRLIDMGVEPFLVASSLIMLSAQRLCRKLCFKCRKPVEISQDFLRKIGFTPQETKGRQERDAMSLTGFTPQETKGRQERDAMSLTGFTPHLWDIQKETSKAEFNKGAGFKEKATFYTAPGCQYCNNTGFLGRLAIAEAVKLDDNIREMIITQKSLDEIREYAQRVCAMKTLRDDAYLKVKEGLTTLDEVLRITTEE